MRGRAASGTDFVIATVAEPLSAAALSDAISAEPRERQKRLAAGTSAEHPVYRGIVHHSMPDRVNHTTYPWVPGTYHRAKKMGKRIH